MRIRRRAAQDPKAQHQCLQRQDHRQSGSATATSKGLGSLAIAIRARQCGDGGGSSGLFGKGSFSRAVALGENSSATANGGMLNKAVAIGKGSSATTADHSSLNTAVVLGKAGQATADGSGGHNRSLGNQALPRGITATPIRSTVGTPPG